MVVGNQESITIGDPFDRENNKDIIFETYEINKKTLPQFISFKMETMEYSIAPTTRDKLGKYYIEIRLTDCYGSQKTYNFFVEIFEIPIQ